MSFTALAGRPWSTHFVTQVPSASSSNSNIPTVTCACGFATTDAESILTWLKKDGKDTGAWLACRSEQQESAGCSQSPAMQLPERKSSYPSQAVLPSKNSRADLLEKSVIL